MKKFCKWQIKCKENKEWACTAHLSEGHICLCYKKNYNNAKKFPKCEDVEKY
jgi:hypothetical protein